MPGIQGGPLMHVIAAKAVAFGEALKPEFKTYSKQIVINAQTMANLFIKKDYNLISHGTDTHVLLIDLTNKGISGKRAENILENAGDIIVAEGLKKVRPRGKIKPINK